MININLAYVGYYLLFAVILALFAYLALQTKSPKPLKDALFILLALVLPPLAIIIFIMRFYRAPK
jgi:lipopolysaccharide export LptBFGC system permease protein LptF